jgi:hypothetical protein
MFPRRPREMRASSSVAVLVSLLAVAGVVVALRSSARDGQSELRMSCGRGTPPEALVDKHGNLHVPSDCRALYEFLGTLAIAADKGAGSSELHTWGPLCWPRP